MLKVWVATHADAGTIAMLHAQSWRSAYRGMYSDSYLDGDEIFSERTAYWSNRLTHAEPKQLVLIAETDDRPAGFACAIGSADPKLGTLLDNLHVTDEFKGRGIGGKLMSEVARWCRAESPGEGIFLWVLEQNLPARRFYEHKGAVYVNREMRKAPDGGSVAAVCCAWANLSPLLSE